MGALCSKVARDGELEATEKTQTRPKRAPGFADFSAFLASDSDVQIYKKFDNLASRNLAFLQSELMALEVEIEAFDEVDCKVAEERSEGWMESQLPARCWEVLERKARERDEREVQRMSLVRRLRSLMAEYQDALIRQSRICALDPPLDRSKKALVGWFNQKRPLVGHSYDLFNDEHDLVALRTPPDQDRLTSFLQSSLGYYLPSKRHEGHSWDGVTYFHGQTLASIVSMLSVLLAAILLVGAIVALYFAPDQRIALGLIAVFTTLFAASIGILTNAKKAEIYAATAAYAAVLVVYVSNNQTTCVSSKPG